MKSLQNILNSGCGGRNENCSTHFQWGRRLSSAEMRISCIQDIREAQWLQWGRRLSSAEIPIWMVLPLGRGLASMGPPTFIGGNAIMCERLTGLKPLQWGRRLSSAEMRIPENPSPMSRPLQWGRRLSSAEIRSPPCVSMSRQGASMGPPTFIGGNPSRFRYFPTGHTSASMGPPTFIGGNRMAFTRASPTPTCFNGAADFHRRKCPPRQE